jgi:DNA-binding response OmpR family regulator
MPPRVYATHPIEIAAFTGSSQADHPYVTVFADSAENVFVRMETTVNGKMVIRSGTLEIRPQEFVALAGGRPMPLTRRELDLLTALAEREGRIVSRGELYSVVWGEPFRKSDRSVDVYVARLRSKLERGIPGLSFIHTHFGFGYRFSPEPSRR